MGRQLGGINGPFVGRVGNAVGYLWRGQWCVRSLPREFHDAKTERQMEQRELFRASVAFAGRLKDILHLGFDQPALKVHKTVCNYFLMVNKRCLAWSPTPQSSGQPPSGSGAAGGTLAVDFEHLRLSEGPVAPVAFQRQPNSSLFTLHFSFDKNPEHRNCSSSDKVYVVALCRRNGVFEAVLPLPVYRRMGSITVTLPSYWEGEEVHLYGFVQDIAGRCSESCYLGTAEALESEEEADGLFHQEFLGGDTRGGGDAEEVGARGPGGDVEGGGETRGGPVKEPVPQDVGGLDMRHG